MDQKSKENSIQILFKIIKHFKTRKTFLGGSELIVIKCLENALSLDLVHQCVLPKNDKTFQGFKMFVFNKNKPKIFDIYEKAYILHYSHIFAIDNFSKDVEYQISYPLFCRFITYIPDHLSDLSLEELVTYEYLLGFDDDER